MTDETQNDQIATDVSDVDEGDNQDLEASPAYEEQALKADSDIEEQEIEADSDDDEEELEADSDDDEEELEADSDDDEEELEADSNDDEEELEADSDVDPDDEDFSLEVQKASSDNSDDEPTYVDQNQKRLLQSMRLEARIEAVIFASQKPLKVNELIEILGDEDLTEEDVQSTIDQLIQDYENRVGGFTLKYVARMGYQFQTANEAGPIMARMFASRPRPISRAALETLSIIAYRQPVTRAQVEFIRGVDAGSIFKTLMERELVKCVGRKEVVGRPMLFGTTDEFLKVFNLASLKELPSLESFQPAPEAIQGAKAKLEGEQDVDLEQYISDNTDGDDPSKESRDFADTEEDDDDDRPSIELAEADAGKNEDIDTAISDPSELLDSRPGDVHSEKSGAVAASSESDNYDDDSVAEDFDEGINGSDSDFENTVSGDGTSNDNDLKV